MKNVSMIAAIGRKNELGKNNNLIWKFDEDMKFFRRETQGKTVVMGYNTLMSLPGSKPLPKRRNIVLTSKNRELEGVIVLHSKEEVIQFIDKSDDEFYIIGGATVYQTFIDLADRLVLTEIDAEDQSAEVFFPKFDKSEYNVETLATKEEQGITFSHNVYTKRR